MNIGIIGSGHIGGNLGIHFAKAGHKVLFSSRHPEQLKELAEKAGEDAKIASVKEAVDFGDLIVLSIPFWALEDVENQVGPLKGKTVIETANPYPDRDGEIAQIVRNSEKPASVFVAKHFPEAHVVKAFNTIYYEHLRDQANRQGKWRAIPYAGDDEESLQIVKDLIKEIGFDPVYVGKLTESHPMDVDQALYNRDLTADQVRQIINKI